MILDTRKPPNDVAGYKPAAIAGDCFYDVEAADRAVRFFQVCLCHVKGKKWAGKPIILEPWQADIIRTLFGWMNDHGTRRYRECYIEIPRKNGKTTLVAGIGLYMLLCDDEQGAEIYSAASDRDQASLAFNIAASMIRKNPLLSERIKVLDSVKRAVVKSTDSFYRAIPCDVEGSHGYNAHAVLADELHTWINGDEFYDVLHTSTGAREQPLTLAITTAGYDRHSLCWKMRQKAERVRDGKDKDPAFLPVIYSAPDDADWTDPKVWAAANPNLGVSVSEEYIARECSKAQENPAAENTFRRLHLNQWTSQKTRWLPMDLWAKCGGATSDHAGKVAYGGLDLASTTDITAWVLLFPREGGYDVLCKFWIAEDRMHEIERTDRVPYTQWVREGWVTALPGAAITYEFIEKQILDDAKLYDLRQVGYDPWNAEQTRQRLESQGVTMVQLRQGVPTLGEPTKELERLVRTETINHGDNPVLNWMAENVEVRTDTNGNIKPIRPEHNASGKKIDGIVALIMAISLGMVHRDTTSVYEQEGQLAL